MIRINERWVVPVQDLIAKKLGDAGDDPKYERHFRDFVNTWLPTKNCMLDIGANIGIYTKPCAAMFKQVIAFEPAPLTFECLEINVNHCDNVTLMRCGVGPHQIGAKFVFNSKNTGATKQVTDHKNGSNIFISNIVTMDSLGLDEVNYIKIDVEGFELDVIKSGIDTITKNLPWIQFELNEQGDVVEEFLNSIGNYRVAYINDLGTRLMVPTTGPNQCAANTPLFEDS